MSFWIKADGKEVYLNMHGEVYAEQMEFLQNNLMEHFQYGYRRIVLDLNNVKWFDNSGIPMLISIREGMLKRGGELIVKDRNSIVGQLV